VSFLIILASPIAAVFLHVQAADLRPEKLPARLHAAPHAHRHVTDHDLRPEKLMVTAREVHLPPREDLVPLIRRDRQEAK